MSVEKIDILYIGEQTLRVPNWPHIEDKKGILLPTEFEINSSWRIQHYCVNCNSKVVGGADEPILDAQPTIKFVPLLTEKYSKLETIYAFEKIFSDVIIEKINGEIRLLKRDYDKNFPGAIRVFYYSCSQCFMRYFADHVRGYGGLGERGEPPRVDLMHIRQIVSANIPSELLQFKKKPDML